MSFKILDNFDRKTVVLTWTPKVTADTYMGYSRQGQVRNTDHSDYVKRKSPEQINRDRLRWKQYRQRRQAKHAESCKQVPRDECATHALEQSKRLDSYSLDESTVNPPKIDDIVRAKVIKVTTRDTVSIVDRQCETGSTHNFTVKQRLGHPHNAVFNDHDDKQHQGRNLRSRTIIGTGPPNFKRSSRSDNT